MSSFGRVFRVTTFGESHCLSVGCVIDGVPPGMKLTEADVQPQLTRRRPGQSRLTTPRDEQDLVKINSGTDKGLTLGTPIMMQVQNLNIRPEDYKEMNAVPRPGHADATYLFKYGRGASSGGGRASARETIGRVAAGAVAEKFLNTTFGTCISSFVTSVGDVELPQEHFFNPSTGKPWTKEEVDTVGTIRVIRGTAPGSSWQKGSDAKAQKSIDDADENAFLAAHAKPGSFACYKDSFGQIYDANGVTMDKNAVSDAHLSDELIPVRCPHPPTACRIATLIRQVKSEQDSIGGTVGCVCTGVPLALGEPCFDKLEAMLAHAMLSLPATKGFEIGLGFKSTSLRGSQHNDPFEAVPGQPGGIRPKTNNAGGTLGGISTGAPIIMRVAVKPVSTIGRAQDTVDYYGNSTVLEAKGRHDPCVLPRVPPLIEAMAALVLADMVMLQRARLGGSVTVLEEEEHHSDNGGKRVKLDGAKM